MSIQESPRDHRLKKLLLTLFIIFLIALGVLLLVKEKFPKNTNIPQDATEESIDVEQRTKNSILSAVENTNQFFAVVKEVKTENNQTVLITDASIIDTEAIKNTPAPTADDSSSENGSPIQNSAVPMRAQQLTITIDDQTTITAFASSQKTQKTLSVSDIQAEATILVELLDPVSVADITNDTTSVTAKSVGVMKRK